MATFEDSQQHQIKDLAGAEENIPTSRETAPLLRNERRSIRARMSSNFYCRRQRCYVSSKAALLILMWNLILVAGLKGFLDPNFLILFEIILTQVSSCMPAFIAFLLIPCGLVCFSANVMQYGVDQLHDTSMEDLYIHWYVWTSYAGLYYHLK